MLANSRLPFEIERAKQVNRALQEVLEAKPEDRQKALRWACGTDESLRREVEAMLEDVVETSPFLPPGGAFSPDLLQELGDVGTDFEVRRVGRYRMLRILGQGGMGVVYLAERADGEYEQRVALKLLVGGFEDSHLERFHRERQILARLEHPNIARLLDGGTTEHGAPYLVMEWVEGSSVDSYCEAQRLSVGERVELLITICGAVQAAHRQLIVHRDLKPANILVTDQDQQVKLLDFGIARILAAGDPSGTGPSLTVSRLMTPQYASPEQILGRPVGIASDVYQLGLLAYELLSGRRPYDLHGLQAHAALRQICEVEPEPAGKAWEKAAEARSCDDEKGAAVDSPWLRSRPPGRPPKDLDLIVAKALRKEPDRRYGSVEQFRDDLERFAAGRPISARRPSWAYLSRRFVGRHALAVAVSVVSMSVIIGLVIVFASGLARERDQTQQALSRAEEEQALAQGREAEAEAVVGFLSRLFQESNPFTLGQEGEDLEALDLLELGAATLETELADEPLIRARLLRTVGIILCSRGRFEQGLPLVEEAVELLRRAPESRRLDLANALKGLGSIHMQVGLPGASKLVQEALEIQVAELGRGNPTVAMTELSLANIVFDQGKFSRAAHMSEQALLDLRASPQPDPYLISQALVGLGASLQQTGRLAVAGARFEEARALYEKDLPLGHPLYGVILENLGLLEADRGRHGKALELYGQAAEIFDTALGADHFMNAQLWANSGLSHLELGQVDKAEDLLEAALRVQRTAFSEGHVAVAESQILLAAVRLAQGRPSAAETLARQALDADLDLIREDHVLRGLAHSKLGASLAAQGKLGEAEGALIAALELFERLGGRSTVYVGEALLELARIEVARKSPEKASRLLRRAVEGQRSISVSEAPELRRLETALAELESSYRASEEAQPSTGRRAVQGSR